MLSACGPRLAGGQNSDCAEPCEAFEVVWVGDILLADRAQPQLDAHGYDWAFERVAHLLDGDFLVGNLEGPLTLEDEPYFTGEPWHYNARPESAAALAAAGFDALSLANNHAFDRGPDGLLDTLAALDENGLRSLGAGVNAEQAAEPLLIDTPYGLLAVVAFGRSRPATAGVDTSGLAPFTPEAIEAGYDLARERGADWVVGYVHWGQDYSGVVLEQTAFAGAFAGAGYDLVIGHHPHIAQGVGVVDGMPVVYSLGNFAFGTAGRFSEAAPGYGLVARTFLGPEGFTGIELTCILTDNDRVQFQPRPCPGVEARRLFADLGTLVELRGDKGFVPLPPAP